MRTNMQCQTCGAPLAEGARFCKKCGAEVKPQTEQSGKLAALWKKVTSDRGHWIPIAGGVLLLMAALLLIVCIVSCGRTALKTPEDAADAVVAALNKGDGDALCSLAKTAAPFLGRHSEQFGEGDTPEAVMKAYYRALASDLYDRLRETYGRRFRLSAQLRSETVTGSGIFEPNRALNLEAEQYVILTGPLCVGDDTVATLRLVAAEQNGEWKILVVYVY